MPFINTHIGGGAVGIAEINGQGGGRREEIAKVKKRTTKKR